MAAGSGSEHMFQSDTTRAQPIRKGKHVNWCVLNVALLSSLVARTAVLQPLPLPNVSL